MTIKTRSAKNKGKKFQNDIAKKISDLLNLPWGRDECIASREIGQPGVDIRLVSEALKRFPYSVECKRCEKWDIHTYIKQAKSNLLPNTDWLLFCRRNNEAGVVIIDIDVFFDILKQISR
jgi:hypothetical protein